VFAFALQPFSHLVSPLHTSLHPFTPCSRSHCKSFFSGFQVWKQTFINLNFTKQPSTTDTSNHFLPSQLPSIILPIICYQSSFSTHRIFLPSATLTPLRAVTMFNLYALALLALVGPSLAVITPTSPDGATVVKVGQPIAALWTADTTGDWTNTTIQLMTGANLNASLTSPS